MFTMTDPRTGDRSRSWFGLLVFGLLTAAPGCGSSDAPSAIHGTIRVGVLPGENRDALRDQFGPLLTYLGSETGVTYELVLHDSYEEFQQAFERRKVDLGWFGGYTFANVYRSSGAVPLVSRSRDSRFTSYFLVRTDNSAHDLNVMRGRRFAFGSRLSTSGHLMPRFLLQNRGIDPESFFREIRFTGAHDRTAMAVRDGEVDLGVANGSIIDTMYASGKLDPREVRILRVTPPFMDYVWACQPHLEPQFRSRLIDAFLDLSVHTPAHKLVLSPLRARYFVPVDIDQFKDLIGIIEQLAIAETAG